jgi:hypothetical protein
MKKMKEIIKMIKINNKFNYKINNLYLNNNRI